MSELVRAVVAVSDGILVEFESGECCYYPAKFLLAHQLTEPNHVFLNYDPSAVIGRGEALPAVLVRPEAVPEYRNN